MKNTIYCKISDQALNTDNLSYKPAHQNYGALNSFVGIVRAVNVGKDVIAVEYDAFVPIAEKVLFEISTEAQQKWGMDLNIIVQHRIGRLNVGEASVHICVFSKHRDEAFLASRYIIEQIKVRVPIWKKEFYSNGETEWLKGHALCQHAELS